MCSIWDFSSFGLEPCKLSDIEFKGFDDICTFGYQHRDICDMFISTKKKTRFDKGSLGKYTYVLIMSAALIINSYFKTKAAAYLDSAQLYPLNQGMALILSVLIASVLFKEKLTAKCVIGIFIAFAGLLIMNVL